MKTGKLAQVIVVTNQKGGVGKSLLSFQTGMSLARRGYKVLVVDGDPQGNLTENVLASGDEDVTAHVLDIYKGQTPIPQTIAPGLDLIGSDIRLAPVAEGDFEVIFKLREGLEPYRGSYDLIVIDSLPSLGYLHMANLAAAEFCLIPAKPSKHAFSGLVDQLNAVEKARKRLAAPIQGLGVILNLIDTKNVILERDFEQRLREEYGDLVFKTTLRKRVAYEESATVGSSIELYDRKGTARVEFEAYFGEFLKRIGRIGRG